MLQGISEIVLRKPPKSVRTHADSSVAAKCCQRFPLETGKHGEHINGGERQVAYIAMNTKDFGDFAKFAVPRLIRRNLSFVLLTGMSDQAVPWEIFHCNLGLTGTHLRKFLALPQLRAWWTQNWDIIPHPNKRIGHGACQDRMSHTREADSDLGSRPGDLTLMRKTQPVPIGIRLHSSLIPHMKGCHAAATLRALRSFRASAPPFSLKRNRVLISFSAARDRRAAALRNLDRFPELIAR